MNNTKSDLKIKFEENVDNLLFVVDKIIQAKNNHQEVDIFLKDLESYYQAVKEIKEQRETLKEKITKDKFTFL